jgi:hypothetical protein
VPRSALKKNRHDTIPVKEYKINDQILGVRTCRKVAKRTMPPPLEDEDLPVAKRQRRQTPTRILTAADGVVNHVHTADTATMDSADDTPTDPAALLPIATISRAPSRSWKLEDDAKLTKEVKKHGKGHSCEAILLPIERIYSVVNDGSSHRIFLMGRRRGNEH